MLHAAWRIFIPVKRFKLTEAKTTHRLMNRLAAPACPPGDFWAEPRKCEKRYSQGKNPYTCDHTRHNMMNTIKSTRKQLPLPGFLAKLELVCVSLHKKLPLLCFPLQPTWFQSHHSSQSAPILWKTLASVQLPPLPLSLLVPNPVGSTFLQTPTLTQLNRAMKRGERGQLTTAKSQTTSTHCMIENCCCVLPDACRSDWCLLSNSCLNLKSDYSACLTQVWFNLHGPLHYPLFFSSYDLLSLTYYPNYVHLTPKTKNAI